MDHLLVVGIETLVGANLAATLADRYRVSTWSAEPGIEIPETIALDPADAPRELISRCRPDIVLYCGPAARSAWEPGAGEQIHESVIEDTCHWAAAAQEHDCRFVMISSDAVFTGPWMFHDEESPVHCNSDQAQRIRAAEQQAGEHCERTLILRTNAFGWSGHDAGWLESLLETIRADRFVQQDHIRHATPILATDLAEILHRALEENLTGTFHVAGAERVSPLKFAQRLADQFDLPWLAVRKDESLLETPAGFAEGECSLLTKRIRKELCVAMPLLSEGLGRLKEQAENGFRDRLQTSRTQSSQRRAA